MVKEKSIRPTNKCRKNDNRVRKSSFGSTTVIVDSSKNHQRMPKPMHESLLGNRIFTVSNISPQTMYIQLQRESGGSSLTLLTSGTS